MNIAICDDNSMLLDMMISVCQKYVRPGDCMKSYTSLNELNKYLLNNKLEIDLFILDINMSEIKGVELKSLISHICKETNIVFVSDNDSSICETFGKKVIGFLNKADFENQIGSIITQARKEILDVKKIHIVERQKNIELIQKRVFSICAQRVYTVLKYVDYYNANTGEILVKEQLYRISLQKWEDNLDMERFIRINRSSLVSWRYVKEITDKVCMQNEDFYTIPRGKKRIYREMFNQYKLNNNDMNNIYR